MTFVSTNDEKMHLRLYFQHQQKIEKFIKTNMVKMEELHKVLKNNGEEEISGTVGELLSSSGVAINMVRQLSRYFECLTNLSKTTEENYQPSEEID